MSFFSSEPGVSRLWCARKTSSADSLAPKVRKNPFKYSSTAVYFENIRGKTKDSRNRATFGWSNEYGYSSAKFLPQRTPANSPELPDSAS
jgi:hypothetical protein